MNFFDPAIVMTDGRLLKHHLYDNIIEEQTLISYLSHITFEDTDSMCQYDRKLVLTTLKKFRDEEAKNNNNNQGLLSNE